MVTTTVRMLDGIHGHTTNLRPGVPLSLVLEVGSAGLQQRLVDSSSTGDDADHRAVAGRNRLLRSRRQFHFRLVVIRVVDDGGVVSGSSGQLAAISQLLLQLANDSSLGHGADGHHVADGQRRLLAAIDELTRVHALDGDERLLALLKFVGISKLDDGQRRAASGVVNDVFDDAFDVAVAFCVVGGAEASGAFSMFVVRREDR